MSTHARRRAWEDEERAQQQDEQAEDRARSRQPVPVPEADRCAGGKRGRHDFSMLTKGPVGFSDERGDQVARCWYCTKLSAFSLRRIAAWEQTTEGRHANA